MIVNNTKQPFNQIISHYITHDNARKDTVRQNRKNKTKTKCKHAATMYDMYDSSSGFFSCCYFKV